MRHLKNITRFCCGYGVELHEIDIFTQPQTIYSTGQFWYDDAHFDDKKTMHVIAPSGITLDAKGDGLYVKQMTPYDITINNEPLDLKYQLQNSHVSLPIVN